MTANGPKGHKPKFEKLYSAISKETGIEDKKSIQDILEGDVKNILCEKYLKLILKLFLDDDKLIRGQLTSCLTTALDQQNYSDCPPMELFDSDTLDYIVKILMPDFKLKLETKEDATVLSYWDILVRLMGKHLHTKTALLNGMMTVVEKAFKSKDPSVLEASFHSWQVLMSNFALDSKILRNQRRINLLVRPLDMNNAKHESTLKAKFLTWWHLITLLGEDVNPHIQTVLIPFIKLCYGPKTDDKVDQNITSPKTPTTPMSPLKKFSNLEKLCLEALVQMLGKRPLDQALPRLQLSTLESPSFTPLQLCEHADLVVHAVLEATSHVNPGNKTEVLKIEVIWDGLASLLKDLSSTSTQIAAPGPVVQEGLNHYFSAVKLCVVQHRRQEKLYNLLLKILGNAASLPPRILNSTSQSSDHRRPSSFLFDLLLYPDFLTESANNEEYRGPYMHIVTTLTEKLLSPPTNLANLADISSKLEVLLPAASKHCLLTISEIWEILAESTAKLEVLGDKQTSGVDSYSTAIDLLVIPISWLYWRGVKADSKLWTVWDTLYQAVSAQTELSVNHSTAFLAHEMGEKLSNLANNQTHPPGLTELAVHARCTRSAIENLDLASLARAIKPDAMLAGFRRLVSPVGSATPLVNHLKTITSQFDTYYNKSGPSHGDVPHTNTVINNLLQAVTSLAAVSQPGLIRPILKIVSPILASLLSHLSNPQTTDMKDLLESTFATVCSLLKVRYNGDYSVELLEEVEHFLIAGMQSHHRSIQNKVSETWAVTFSNLPKASLPQKMKDVLKNSNSPCKTGREQVASSSDVSFPSSSDSFSQQVTTAPGMEDLLTGKRHPLIASPGGSAKKMPAPKIQAIPAKKKTRKSLNLQLLDDDSADFVTIQPKTRKKRLLTDHQKDVLTSRHDDIPALYSELSRDDSIVHLPPEFQSQDSILEKTVEEPIKELNEDNPIEGTALIEQFDSEQDSLRKSMRQRKNQKFDPMQGTPSERTKGSPKKMPLRLRSQGGGEKVDSISVDEEAMASGKSLNKESPEKNIKSSEEVKSPETVKKILFDSSDISNNSGDESVIESSQDVTTEPDNRRRSRRSFPSTTSANSVQSFDILPASPSTSPQKKGSLEKKNKFGETPLHLAAKKGDIERVRELLGAGANPNVPDAAGWFPLHEAAVSAEEAAVNIVALLVQNGALMDVHDEKALTTPLHDAVMYGSREVVLELIKAGADTDMKNIDGKTPLDMATSTPSLLQDMKDHIDILKGGAKKTSISSPNTIISTPTKSSLKRPAAEDINEDENVEKVPKTNNAVSDEITIDSSRIEAVTEDSVIIASQSKIDETLEDCSMITDKPSEPVKETPELDTTVEEVLEKVMTEDTIDKGDDKKMDEEEVPDTNKEKSNIDMDTNKVTNQESPDANKENVSSNSDSEETEKTEKVSPMATTVRMKTPFTALNEKAKSGTPTGKIKRTGSSSRGAMLLSLAASRRSNLEQQNSGSLPPTPGLLSPSPKIESAKRPWMKYAPSPSSASPSTSCLKRSADDLDSSIEGSLVSVKRLRLSDMGSRRVHFNDNPVSDSVEIPRAPEGKHTRKKLQMSGYDQDIFLARVAGSEKTGETKCETLLQTIYPELCDCDEPISTISHQLATGQWGKTLQADLKSRNITKIGQLASMDCREVKLLRGVKPPKEVTVKNALKSLHIRLKKETPVADAVIRVRAPVVEAEATQEEEEEIKAALFSRPSPTPTDEDEDDHPTASSQVTRGESPPLSPIRRIFNTAEKISDEDIINKEAEDVEADSSENNLRSPTQITEEGTENMYLDKHNDISTDSDVLKDPVMTQSDCSIEGNNLEESDIFKASASHSLEVIDDILEKVSHTDGKEMEIDNDQFTSEQQPESFQSISSCSSGRDVEPVSRKEPSLSDLLAPLLTYTEPSLSSVSKPDLISMNRDITNVVQKLLVTQQIIVDGLVQGIVKDKQ